MAFLAATSAQRLVYWRAGRLYVEHLVLFLHAATFAILLGPVVDLVSRFVPAALWIIAPVIVAYWVLALRDVFNEALHVTFVRAGLVVTLAAILFMGAVFGVFLLQELVTGTVAAS